MSSSWLIGGGVLLALWLANAVMAYRYRSRRMLAEGQQPPPFLKYLFFPKPLPRHVTVPRPLRIAMGVFILLGGLFFLFISFFLMAEHPSRTFAPYLIRGLVAMFGAAFVYVGIRLMSITSDRHRLFERRNGNDGT
jgi:hypothetical protein